METGRRKDQSGDLVPPHHITEIKVIVNGMKSWKDMGYWDCKKPIHSLQYFGKKGDIVKLKLLIIKK
ncbi:MAG: hypothetical protein Ct9H300mP28_31090 [Pseudomonadota bacterium]|nr:MAG: hypothetical protein Ct9H300mP28_31090 [Pseudomonadota bacterium]